MSASNAYVIEIDDETVGLVVRQLDEATNRRRYRFYASTARFRAIEGLLFRSPAKAQRAAQALHREKAHAYARRPNGAAPRAPAADTRAFCVLEIA